MIMLILCSLKNKTTGKKEMVVSHGIDLDTFENITLPSVPPNEIGYFNRDILEWVLK